MRTSDRAWLGLAAGVLAYDALCPKGEMLSEASARYSETHRALWFSTVAYIAAHLTHIIPDRYDPLSRIATALGR